MSARTLQELQRAGETRESLLDAISRVRDINATSYASAVMLAIAISDLSEELFILETAAGNPPVLPVPEALRRPIGS